MRILEWISINAGWLYAILIAAILSSGITAGCRDLYWQAEVDAKYELGNAFGKLWGKHEAYEEAVRTGNGEWINEGEYTRRFHWKNLPLKGDTPPCPDVVLP